MKKFTSALLCATIAALFLLTISCKKKKTDPLPTAMTMVVNDDTVWTTTKVVTDASNAPTIYIKGTSPDGAESLSLAISGYKGAKGTFLVDYRGTGGNIYGNTAMYLQGSNAIEARTGKIVITSATETLITGTFDMYYQQTNFKGTFTAPAK